MVIHDFGLIISRFSDVCYLEEKALGKVKGNGGHENKIKESNWGEREAKQSGGWILLIDDTSTRNAC